MADALGTGSLLVVAGAGFGKTTAIEAAVQPSRLTSAWVPCSEGEDAGTLMARILAALRRAMPGMVDVLGERLVVPGQRVDPTASPRRSPTRWPSCSSSRWRSSSATPSTSGRCPRRAPSWPSCSPRAARSASPV
jgi:hypothetical protein